MTISETLTAYPTSRLKGMVGFAKASGTSGGWSGKVKLINNLQELIQNAKDNQPMVLVINSNITATTKTKVNLGSNKSIIGSFGSRTLHNIHLRATKTSSNIIFQNLIFSHSAGIKGNDDIQLYLNYGSKYWIDHCSFIGHKWSKNDGSLDKLIYIGDSADFATISNCYFGNHKYGLILGHPEDDNNKAFEGHPHLTICHNHYENMEVRAPGLMRYGYFHVYNNYIDKFHLGFTLASNAKIFSEKNYFENGNAELDDKGNGLFTDIGSLQSIRKPKSPKNKWTPGSSYNYKAMTAAEAKAFATANVGSKSSELVFGS
ncbi:pectin lyase-like [Sitodiplosis mosellana]|uniref:pectin lyase-like n=1 Tax=Sitodiplosis mosellana TaxID=263140 RepID=UPI002444C44E|nr:pectin lyase-like [Sitodiplosis mosellana]